MAKRTPAQHRQAVARELEAMATPANPKVKPGDVTLSAAKARKIIGALKK